MLVASTYASGDQYGRIARSRVRTAIANGLTPRMRSIVSRVVQPASMLAVKAITKRRTSHAGTPPALDRTAGSPRAARRSVPAPAPAGAGSTRSTVAPAAGDTSSALAPRVLTAAAA